MKHVFCLVFLVLLTGFTGLFCACHSLESANSQKGLEKDLLDSTTVIVKFINEPYEFDVVKRAGFIKKFKEFYEDGIGRFFIRSYGHKKTEKNEFEPIEVFIEIPRLDSATFKNLGLYLMDSSKVISAYPNSDGGNYILLKDADPKSFHVFKHAFGGKDNDHVYYQAKKLEGLNARTVKVYSDLKNCKDCTPYFRDGNTCYFGEEKSDCTIPSEYKIVE